MEGKQPDKVVLLHGIASGPWSLRKMDRLLCASGYKTINLGYPSRRMPLEQLVEHLHPAIAAFGQSGAKTHFVVNSMGGLLARSYLSLHRPSNLGRVVMLAPPNQGSEIADLLVKTRIYRWFFGPAGSQLTTVQDAALLQALGKVDYPLGVIAGDRFIDALGWSIIPGANDGRVSIARTKINGMADHVTVHATHFGIARNRAAIDHTIHFLRHGTFRR